MLKACLRHDDRDQIHADFHQGARQPCRIRDAAYMAATDQTLDPNNPLAMQEPSIHGPRELPADAPPVRAPLATANDMPHDAGYRCRVSRGLDGFSPDRLTDLLRKGARQLIAQAVEA